MALELTAQEKSQVEAAVGAIDWSKVDWEKIGAFLQLLLQLLLAKQPVKAAADLAHCSHAECCFAALTSSLQTTAACAQACQNCGDEHDH